jgi:hypothetical protein
VSVADAIVRLPRPAAMPFSFDVVSDFLIPSAGHRLSAIVPPLRSPFSRNARRRASLATGATRAAGQVLILLDAGQPFDAS